MENKEEEYEVICGNCRHWDFMGWNCGYCRKNEEIEVTRTEYTCDGFEFEGDN